MLVLRKARAARLLVGEELMSSFKGGTFSLFASPSFITFEILARLDLGVGSGVRGQWFRRVGSALRDEMAISVTAG